MWPTVINLQFGFGKSDSGNADNGNAEKEIRGRSCWSGFGLKRYFDLKINK